MEIHEWMKEGSWTELWSCVWCLDSWHIIPITRIHIWLSLHLKKCPSTRNWKRVFWLKDGDNAYLNTPPSYMATPYPDVLAGSYRRLTISSTSQSCEYALIAYLEYGGHLGRGWYSKAQPIPVNVSVEKEILLHNWWWVAKLGACWCYSADWLQP